MSLNSKRFFSGLGTIPKVIGAIILALAILFGYSLLQVKIFGRGDYLLFVADIISYLPLLFIGFFAEYKYYNFAQNEINDYKTKPSRRRKIVERICIVVIIILTYLGITNYSILYKDGVKVASPIKPAGAMYKYSDISKVNVKVKRTFDGSNDISYKLIFNNGDSAELYYGSVYEGVEENYMDILLRLDKQLKEQGIEKEVDKKNFEKYSNGLDQDHVSKVEKLFE